MLHIVKDEQSTHIHFSLQGELDMSTSGLLMEELQKVSDKNLDYVFDFTGLHFIDSTGVGHLLFECRKIQERGRTIAFRHLNEEIFMVFDLLGVPSILGEDCFTN